jgi:outer membrane protein assembly factor BamA
MGGQIVTIAALQRALSGVAIGTAYSETSMRMMLDASVRPLYDARGRIRVSFPKIETAPAKDYDGVTVTVTVIEGPSYSLGDVSFAGVSRDDAAELKRIANLQPNDVVNFDDVNAALEKIYTRFREKGYLRVSGKADREIDDKEHKVAVTLAIDPGSLFVMGKLEIIGLDLISEPPIRKTWSIHEGAPFDPEYPDLFLKGLRDEGVFDNLGKTRSDVNVDEKTHTVGVKLYFAGAGPKEEKKRGGRGGLGAQ